MLSEARDRLAKAMRVMSMLSSSKQEVIGPQVMDKVDIINAVEDHEREAAFAIREAVFVDEQKVAFAPRVRWAGR